MGKYSKERMEQMLKNYEREEEWWKGVLALDATFNREEMEDIRQRYGIPK
jgi:flagellar biosynthesis GTPase FlhF